MDKIRPTVGGLRV